MDHESPEESPQASPDQPFLKEAQIEQRSDDGGDPTGLC
jgi:hypothetical protein